jgi:hypothetical protein
MKAVFFFKLSGINNPATWSNNPEDLLQEYLKRLVIYFQNEVTINLGICGSKNNKLDLVFEEVDFLLHLVGV